MAHAYPSVVRRIYNEGHTIGTHSQDHPLAFQRLSLQRVKYEVDDGIASVDSAIGDAKAVAPFFRIPGFGRSKTADDFLASQSLVTGARTWSHWFRHISAQTIVQRALQRLDAKGRGILLLHNWTLPPLWRCRRCSRSSRRTASMWFRSCRRAIGRNLCPN